MPRMWMQNKPSKQEPSMPKLLWQEDVAGTQGEKKMTIPQKPDWKIVKPSGTFEPIIAYSKQKHIYVLVCPYGEETPIRRASAFPYKVKCPKCSREGRARWIRHLKPSRAKMLRGMLIFNVQSRAYRNFREEKQQ